MNKLDIILSAIITLSITITWSIIDKTFTPVITNVVLVFLLDLMIN